VLILAGILGAEPENMQIDLKRWKRRDHFVLFRSYAQPFFSVCVDVDVTRLWHASRRPGQPSFFLASLYLMLKAANDIEAFRLRLRKRGVWLHDRVAVGPTIARDDDTFGFARLELTDTLTRFAVHGEAAIARIREERQLASGKGKDDAIIFHSTLPWFRFTSFTNALPGGDDSIPRVVFGKCVAEGKSMTMPVAIEVHHALVDGADVAKFVEHFQTALTSFGAVE
jgi:chloramphenicol O-acetyltransferase type A